MNATGNTVRISCNCSTCEANAAALGKAFPLVGFIRQEMADGLKITAKNCDNPKKVHGLVRLAHEPAMGHAQSAVLAG